MNPQELARWLLDEHEKVKELSDRLLERVAIAPQANQHRWIAEARDAFEHFRAHMIKHMALEAQDGYMVPVVHRRPALSRAVDRLAHEHEEMTQLLDGIYRTLMEVRPEDGLIIRDCCKRIQSLLEYVRHHESEENFLVMSAFTDDIGTKD